VRVPTARELFDLWERGRHAPPGGLTPYVLAVACTDRTLGELDELSLGRRDALLMTLHERLFGPRIAAVAMCGACHERLDTIVSLAELRSAVAEDSPAVVEVEADGYDVEARVPTGQDLEALASSASVEEGVRRLLARCVQAAHYEGRPVGADDLPSRVVDAVSERLAAADPLADVWLQLKCAACGHAWSTRLDIERFFAAALGAWAEQMLDDVHDLARAYAWSEAEILALSAWRRRHYLSRVRA
jgi:hypothetical protein